DDTEGDPQCLTLRACGRGLGRWRRHQRRPGGGGLGRLARRRQGGAGLRRGRRGRLTRRGRGRRWLARRGGGGALARLRRQRALELGDPLVHLGALGRLRVDRQISLVIVERFFALTRERRHLGDVVEEQRLRFVSVTDFELANRVVIFAKLQ